MAKEQTTLIFQINGKTRGTFLLDPIEAEVQERVEAVVKENQSFQRHVKGQILKVVFVPGKIINFVVKD